MKLRIAVAALALVSLCACARAGARQAAVVEMPAWGEYFKAAGVTGTVAVRKHGEDRTLVFDAARAAAPCLPASTFKILNSCIALQTGVVTGPGEVFRWDGVTRSVAAWNRDMTMAEAFSASNVPVFQEIARRIGQKRMAAFVREAGYGNADIGGGIDRFWLEGKLRISAMQQLDFLERLRTGGTPFTPETVGAVAAMMTVDKGPGWTLRGKTGWAVREKPGTGWFVGWAERGGEVWYFAVNIDMNDLAQAGARVGVARAALRGLGALP